MEIFQSAKIAFRALRVNKTRSFLTMLGIIIGIAAVIVMVAIGSGARTIIAEQISSVGSNILLVIPGSTTSGGIRVGAGSTMSLTYEDAEAVQNECPSVYLVSPIIRGTAQVVYGNQNWSTLIMGSTPAMIEVREWPLVAGRNFTKADVSAATKTCLLGQTVVEMLFGSEDPLGKIIRIKNVPFAVIGVLESKGQSPHGSDQDDVVFIPLRTAQRKIFGGQFPNSIGAMMVKTKTPEDLAVAEKEVSALLNQRHRIAPGKESDFSVRNLAEILSVAEKSSQVMSLLLGAVASISLIVGGIGIMNIMLVSVTERTREIGIRMAIGAKERDILFQFLIEAVLLTVIGGFIGMLVGSLGAVVVGRVLDWPILISLQSILIAFFFSAAVGLFFGFYPARKAAGMNPIDALRYE